MNATVAERLNRECDCTVVDLVRAQARVDACQPGGTSPSSRFFSALPVFVAREHFETMRLVVAAMAQVVRLPAYQSAAIARAPDIARVDPRNEGVFFGFDFHLTRDGPRLIEINTNAGGAFLNAAARDAQVACCAGFSERFVAQPAREALEAAFIAMFHDEWRRARGDAPLRTIAIVDEDPAGQFLRAEFELAAKLFESRGIRALVADRAALTINGGELRLGSERIDLVYNRLTDFYLESPESAALRRAFVADLAVITPHPRAHALYADKRNLALLSDASALARFGATRDCIETLVGATPMSRIVDGDAAEWWRDRKAWFFKPAGGFGSRATYRGDRITRRKFDEVIRGGFIAQQLTPASLRGRDGPGDDAAMKVDVRAYAYAGRIQLMAARLYRGQVTNFRTAGGGFAPLFVVDEAMARA